MKPAYTYRATVMRIYDGDTIYVDIDLGCGVHITGADGRGEPLRLYGIDTPEIRGEERPEGLVAKDRVVELIPVGTEIVIETVLDKKGKYGRLLAVVHYEAEPDLWRSLNSQLVTEGLAENYPG
jgi:micrococcal nuclease